MDCLVCKFNGEFGRIEIQSSDGYTFAWGWMPKPKRNIVSVDLFVCPNCGALHSTMGNTIKMEERKL